MSFFEQILNAAAKYFGDTVKRLGAGFVDVLVPLLIHLDGAKGKTVTVKYSKLKKKTQKLAVSKVITFTNKGYGTKTYTKASGKMR